MAAAALVALVRRYAPIILESITLRPVAADAVVFVGARGFWIAGHAHTGPPALLSAPITAESVASNAAMERALLGSRITTFAQADFGRYAAFYPGDLDYPADLRTGPVCNTREEAREAVLDALLGEVTA